MKEASIRITNDMIDVGVSVHVNSREWEERTARTTSSSWVTRSKLITF